MDKRGILKLIYQQSQSDHQYIPMGIGSIPVVDIIKVDRKARELVKELEHDKLVEIQDSQLILTNMGKYLAKLL